MSFNKKFFTTGGIVAASGVCNTDSKYAFGADSSFTSNVALYQFENNANDTTTNHNGTWSGTEAYDSSGYLGSAGSFNGSSYILLDDINSTDFTPTEYTISAWFKTTSTSKSIISTDAGGSPLSTMTRIFINSSGILTYDPFNISARLTGTSVVNDGNWHFVCVNTDSSGNTKLYVDNVLEASGTGGGVNFRLETWIGCTDSGTYSTITRSNFFNGLIDQVRIFDRVISDSEVATLFAETQATASSINPLNEGQGVALYNLDYDASDAGGLYDGTPTDVTFGVDGNINYGARFNGSSSNIYTNLYQERIGSFSFWMKRDSTPSSNEMLIAYNGSSSSLKGFFTQLQTDGNIRLVMNKGTSGANGLSIYSSGVNTCDGNWHHIVAAWDITTQGSTNSYLYIDGNFNVSGTADEGNWTSGNSSDTYLFGSGSTSNSQVFEGDLDQVRIFSSALTSTQVSTLHAEQACVHTATTTNDDLPVTNAAYYKLDNSAEDEKGSYDGTETDIEYRFGRYGQAAVFNGSSSEISLPTSLVNSQNTFTVSLWAKTNTNTNYSYLFSFGKTSDSDGFGLARANSSTTSGGLNGTTLAAEELYLNVGSSFIGINFTVDEGIWNHFAVSYTGSTAKIYVNGNLRQTYTNAQGIPSLGIDASGNAAYIGRYVGTAFRWNGNIDQFRVFHSILTDDQVTELYNEKPETDTSNFKTVLYTGNGTSSSSIQYISNVGMDLETSGGLIWTKNRDTTDSHAIVDSLRTIGSSTGYIASDTTDLEQFSSNMPSSLEANGFFLKGNGGRTNTNGEDYVSWVWLGGGEAQTLTNAGNVNSDVSVNNEAGFSIVKASYGSHGSGTGYTKTVKHGLTTDPEIIITKMTSNNSNWVTMADTLIGEGKHLLLNDDASIGTDSGFVINTDGTFQTAYSTAAYDIIAYCWHSVAGYSKIGTYEGDGNTNRQVTDVGFQPNFLLIKNSENSVTDWLMYDSKRGTTPLAPNQSFAESTYGTSYEIEFISTGFKIVDSNNATNQASKDFIYMAFK